MENLYTKILIAVGVAAVGIAVIAAEHRPAQNPKITKIIYLKSDGQTVAELRVFGNSASTIRADGEFALRGNKAAKVLGGTNGVVIKIGAVTITAPQAEVIDGAQ